MKASNLDKSNSSSIFHEIETDNYYKVDKKTGGLQRVYKNGTLFFN